MEDRGDIRERRRFEKYEGDRRSSKFDLFQAYAIGAAHKRSLTGVMHKQYNESIAALHKAAVRCVLAVGKLQCRIDCLLLRLPNVACFIDDFVIGPDDDTYPPQDRSEC